MDPKACFEAFLNASFGEKHLYWDDLASWFQRGGCGFEARLVDGREVFVERATHTRRMTVRFKNNRRKDVHE